MKVFIYWNLHRKCWSIKALSGQDRGRVKYHASAWEVQSATFKVSEAGRQRVLREQRKNVHAGVVGELVSWKDLDGDNGHVSNDFTWDNLGVKVTYNPYRGATFVLDNEERTPIQNAGSVKAQGRTVLAAF